MFSHLRRSAAALFVALLISTGIASPAAAEDFSRVDRTSTAGEVIRLTNGEAVETALYHLVVDGDASVPAYCADISTSVDHQAAYIEGGWSDIPDTHVTDPQQLNWIVRNSYPHIDLERLRSESGVSGLTKDQAIAATQAAIWHHTNGADLSTAAGTENGNHRRVQELYTYLVTEARENDAAEPPPSLTVTPGRIKGADPAEPLGPLAVRTTSTSPVALSVKGTSSLRITDADGAPLAEASDGEEFYLRVDPSAPEGVATVYARALDATLEPGRVFTGRDGVQTQPLITADSATAESTTVVKVDWLRDAPAAESGAESEPEPTAPAEPTEPAETASPSPSPSPSEVVIADDRKPENNLVRTGTWVGAIVITGLTLLAAGAAVMSFIRNKPRFRP
ncbi:MAG: thioester domain-containing protein [Nocardiopsaceae bacterium]|nr:thioester domain-containing protein [Nocardiopsaceae bacterium]